ncbi:MAG: molybdate ABC transporter substrate-binding protein [Oscillospiraceae bacterium]
MNFKFKKITTVLISALMICALSACGNSQVDDAAQQPQQSQTQENQDDAQQQSLFVYCGAGLKKPMEKIAKLYEEKNGVKIEYTYAGSAQLISQLELSGKGDVFIIGSETVYEKAKEKGLVGDYSLVAHHTPAIGVPKGNPKNIQSLSDLAKDGVKVILGDKEANAIGKTAAQILKKNALEAIENNVIATPATVNEIVTALASKECDAAIITKDGVFGNEDIEIIEIPAEQNIDQLIPIGTVGVSEKTDIANEFCKFVSSEDGKAIFAEFGFEPVSAEK